MVLTRNGGTDEFIVYVYGVQQIAFTDSASEAVFDIIHFLRDDTLYGGSEHPSGFLDYVRIYDGVLTPVEVQALFEAGDSSPASSASSASPAPLDHFAVYEVRPKAFAGGSGRRRNELNIAKKFTDPFGTSEKTIKKARRILVPLDQNGIENTDAGTSLVCYDFKEYKRRMGWWKKWKHEEIGEDVWVDNHLYDGFEDKGQDVRVKKLKLICVPSVLD